MQTMRIGVASTPFAIDHAPTTPTTLRARTRMTRVSTLTLILLSTLRVGHASSKHVQHGVLSHPTGRLAASARA
eukprot:4814490-Alexandrium_andersonii.AAC.1